MIVDVDIAVGERAVYSFFDKLDRDVWLAVKEKVVELTERLEAVVTAYAPHKSCELAASIHSTIRESAHKIVGIVTSSKAYLPVIEFGIHKQLAVHGYNRRINQVFGREVMPLEITVGPYERAAGVEATFFMEHALRSMDAAIVSEIETVVGAIGEAMSQ